MEQPSLWSSLIPKAKAIGCFSKHCKDHGACRAELLKFVETMVQDLKNDDEEKSTDEHYQFRVCKLSAKKTTPKSRYTDKQIEYTFSSEGHDEFCFLCQKPFEQFTNDLYPCRVCTRAFHKKCVETLKDSECSEFDKQCMERRHTNIGWSCHFCVNLPSLLTGREVGTLVERFDKIDLNKDSVISLAEYSEYKSQTLYSASSEDGKQHIAAQFKKLDIYNDGFIRWRQFFSHESRLALAKRSPDALLDLLTEKEIIYAKAVFSRMDDDGDGVISYTKAMAAYRSWYKKLHVLVSETGCDRASLNLHADVAAKMIMDHNQTETGIVTWEEFLAGQALYIICARPNI